MHVISLLVCWCLVKNGLCPAFCWADSGFKDCRGFGAVLPADLDLFSREQIVNPTPVFGVFLKVEKHTRYKLDVIFRSALLHTFLRLSQQPGTARGCHLASGYFSA
jgi:hypothetical protein